MSSLTTLTVGGKHPVLGTFGKAVDGAVSLNFGLSGGANCNRACRHHPDSTATNPTRACYAVRCEQRPDRSQLHAKLERHEQADPAVVIDEALAELKAKRQPVPWLRLAANGSLPQPREASARFLRSLRALLDYARQTGTPVHIPVETARKAHFYQRHVGDHAVVRESAQTERRFLSTPTAVSFTAGVKPQTRIERVEAVRTSPLVERLTAVVSALHAQPLRRAI